MSGRRNEREDVAPYRMAARSVPGTNRKMYQKKWQARVRRACSELELCVSPEHEGCRSSSYEENARLLKKTSKPRQRFPCRVPIEMHLHNLRFSVFRPDSTHKANRKQENLSVVNMKLSENFFEDAENMFATFQGVCDV